MTSGYTQAELRKLLAPYAVGELVLKPIVGGWRLSRFGDFYIEVTSLPYAYQVWEVPVPRPEIRGRWWRYSGMGRVAFTAACLAAVSWDRDLHAAPRGWNQCNGVSRWRAPAAPGTWQTWRQGYPPPIERSPL